MKQVILEATSYVKSKLSKTPDIAIVLGSGLGPLADVIENPIIIPYDEIPHFPKNHVVGHDGKMVIGTFKGKTVLAMKGRFHYYEGYDLATVALPIRVLASLGIKNLILTNACGGIHESLQPGSIMLIRDHISFLLPSILRGENLDEFGPRFVDMTHVYSPIQRSKAHQVASTLGIELKEGVYAYFPGPMYETPAEIRALQAMGADAVGMSTVGEAIIARHCGMEVLGISLITNKAAGLGKTELSHMEVLETAKKSEANLLNLVSGILAAW